MLCGGAKYSLVPDMRVMMVCQGDENRGTFLRRHQQIMRRYAREDSSNDHDEDAKFLHKKNIL